MYRKRIEALKKDGMTEITQNRLDRVFGCAWPGHAHSRYAKEEFIGSLVGALGASNIQARIDLEGRWILSYRYSTSGPEEAKAQFDAFFKIDQWIKQKFFDWSFGMLGAAFKSAVIRKEPAPGNIFCIENLPADRVLTWLIDNDIRPHRYQIYGMFNATVIAFAHQGHAVKFKLRFADEL